jgi:hypothetical protein
VPGAQSRVQMAAEQSGWVVVHDVAWQHCALKHGAGVVAWTSATPTVTARVRRTKPKVRLIIGGDDRIRTTGGGKVSIALIVCC